MLARTGNGTWSYPAFYTISSASFGLQIGIQDSQVIIMIMTDRGVNAVLDSQVKLGADASLAIATIGGGVQGSTTAAVGADIIAFAQARGLYGGISLAGSVMSSKTGANQSYYGQPYAARQIVISMQGSNPGADPLREVLTRNAAGGGASQAQQPMQPPPGYAPPYQPPSAPSAGYPPGTSGARGPIQEQHLAPPGR